MKVKLTDIARDIGILDIASSGYVVVYVTKGGPSKIHAVFPVHGRDDSYHEIPRKEAREYAEKDSHYVVKFYEAVS